MLYGGQYAVHHGTPLVGLGQVGQQQHKLVTTQAGQCVVCAQDLLQPLRHADQQLITHRMAKTVVDGLEVVQVEVAHRQRVPAAPRSLDGLAQPVDQHATVGNAGQWVEIGQPIQLGLVGLDVADV